VLLLYYFGDSFSKGTIIVGVEINIVEGGSDLNDFIGLPWSIRAGYPDWIPPLTPGKEEPQKVMRLRVFLR
jgi:hypothetical protein